MRMRSPRRGRWGSPREDQLPGVMRASLWTRAQACASILALVQLIACSLCVVAAAAEGDPAGSVEEGAIARLIDQGSYLDAEARARILLEQRERARGSGSPEVAIALDLLVRSMYEGGKASLAETEALSRRAVDLKERLFGSEEPEVAVSLRHLGRLLHFAGRLNDAGPPLERAVRIGRESGPSAERNLADALSALGELRTDMSRYSEADALYSERQRILSRLLGPDAPELARDHHNLARLRYRQGMYKDALEEYGRAGEILTKAYGHSHFANALIENGLAIVYDEINEYVKAREHYERAVAIAEASLPAGDPFLVSCLNNLGRVHQNLADYGRAEELYLRSLEMRVARGEAEDPSTLMNLAEIKHLAGNLAAADSLCRRAIEGWEASVGAEAPELATGLRCLASVRLEMGDLAGAEALFARALSIKEASLGPDHLDLCAILIGLAKVRLIAGEDESARRAYERALEIGRKNLGDENLVEADLLPNLGLMALASGRSDEALEDGLRAEAVRSSHVRATAPFLPERQALGLVASRTAGLDLALTVASEGVLPRAARDCWDAVARSRGQVLEMMALRNRIPAVGGSSDAKRLAEVLAAASARYAELLVQGPLQRTPAAYREDLEAAREKREAIERRLGAISFAFRAARAVERSGLREALDGLPPKTVLLAYVRYDRQVPRGAMGRRRPEARASVSAPAPAETEPSYAVFVANGFPSEIHMIDLGPAERIEGLVRAVQREASSIAATRQETADEAERAYRAAGERLREIVWDPVVPLLTGCGQVFVVPDGALHFINLSALPVEEESYLLEMGRTIHYLSAERDLVVAPISEEAEGLLAIGAPDFDGYPEIAEGDSDAGRAEAPAAAGMPFRGGREPCLEFQSVRFGPLPATKGEVEEIAGLWRRAAPEGSVIAAHAGGGAALILAGSHATESSVKRLAPGKAAIHLATHGFFIAGQCLSAAPAARGIGGLAAAPTEKTPAWRENPLRLAGLALAGANRRGEANPRGEDGSLTAEEIAAMNLEGARWAVLSACDTGLGEIRRNEGILGLQRAFRVAGVRTIIMSLWPVEDRSAGEWMRRLYDARLSKRMTTMDAVQEATLGSLLTRRANGRSTHPFHWAAFVAVGDWR
ncbi:MAG: CHAT domain-containing protein [Candidatus Eisenbacteria bacterium]|nr:CHAT domain-containing protein [Candidatus Eisenbacteria bacterium]